MAKIRTKQKVNWGGWNPFQKNKIEFEMKEISKSATNVVFKITDTVIGEKSYENKIFDEAGELVETEQIVSEFPLQVIREKIFSVPMELYNQLYLAVEQLIPAELTPFEKEQLRPKLAFLFYFQNDKIVNPETEEQFCLYGLQPTDFEIVN